MLSRCIRCKKQFAVKPCLVKNGRQFCSLHCKNEQQKTGQFKGCDTCGAKIWLTQAKLKRSKSQMYFCSKSCQTIWRNKYYSGELHRLWKDGIAAYRRL